MGFGLGLGFAPVDGHAVAVTAYDLRRHVLGRATQRQAPLTRPEHRSKAEVDELQMAVTVEQKVLGLEVPVDDLLRDWAGVGVGVGVGVRIRIGVRVRVRVRVSVDDLVGVQVVQDLD